jgi:hypothetical protein
MLPALQILRRFLQKRKQWEKIELLFTGHLQIHVVSEKGVVEDLGHSCSDSLDIDSVHSMT